MNFKELKELTVEQLSDKLNVEREELLAMRMKHRLSPLKNSTEISKKRKLIARIKTIQNEPRQ